MATSIESVATSAEGVATKAAGVATTAVAAAIAPPAAATAAATPVIAPAAAAGPVVAAATPPRARLLLVALAEPVAAADGPTCWVWDPDDDAACAAALLARHDLDAGQVVCHPRPGASWPVLLEDLLRALGKHPQALTREHRRNHGERLLEVWLRAEPVHHLVILRAHLLDALVHERLRGLATATGAVLWLGWHHRDPPPGRHPTVSWADAAHTLAEQASLATAAPGVDDAYESARAEARSWRPDGHRLGPTVRYWNHAWPGCDVGALLQRLTIDATTTVDLRECLHAAQEGFLAEGRRLTLPPLDDTALALLGPRLPAEVVSGLRSLVCPANAAALMLALATGAEARFLAYLRTGPEMDQVALLAGAYRVPGRVQVLMRAAHLAQRAAPAHGHPLLGLPADGCLVMPQRLAHRVRRGAALIGVDPPPGARPLYGINPATPFAAPVATRSTVTDMINTSATSATPCAN